LSAPEQLDFQLRLAAGDPRGALVLLHGRGADQFDLAPLIDALDPRRRLVGITPQGPLSLPRGGHHWYVVQRVGYPDPDTFRQSYAILERWLEHLPELTGVPWQQTVLGGFSQGAVMSYALGLGAARPSPAGILTLSGFIPSVPGFELQLSHRQGLPVAIGHGSLDPVISVRFARQARERLQAAGLDVRFHESAIAHGIDPEFLPTLRDWLKRTLDNTQDLHL
jgi:phospholipase/carboxylesterase